MPRVIAGRCRGTILAAPPGDKTRPTADRTKEAIFSSLAFRISGAIVLDLCAGSGQLGIEALSRGAKHAVFVDQSRVVCALIKKNLERCRLMDSAEVLCMDTATYLRRMKAAAGAFDLVFFDPPYALHQKLLPALAMQLEDGGLNEGGLLIAESAWSEEYESASPPALKCLKRCKYGSAMVSFYEKV